MFEEENNYLGSKEKQMAKKLLTGLMVLSFAMVGCETFSFGQLGSLFTKAGDALSGECDGVPVSEAKACLEALKDKVVEDAVE